MSRERRVAGREFGVGSAESGVRVAGGGAASGA